MTTPPILTADDINAVAKEMGINPAAIYAVCDVESNGSGFLPDGRPKILFEAHVFGRLTSHQYDEDYPNLSSAAWNRALYGASGAHQWDRLLQAMRLDHLAAQKAASWGKFQIMGENYHVAGYPDVEAFVAGMKTGERAHLEAFKGFCNGNNITAFLQRTPPNFEDFTRRYNGPGQVAHYSALLKAAYQRHYTGG